MDRSNSTSTANGRTAAADFTNAYLIQAGLNDGELELFNHLLLKRYLDDDVPSEK